MNIFPPEIGSVITTSSSNVTGKVIEVIANKTGTFRVRIEKDDGTEKWTTVVAY